MSHTAYLFGKQLVCQLHCVPIATISCSPGAKHPFRALSPPHHAVLHLNLISIIINGKIVCEGLGLNEPENLPAVLSMRTISVVMLRTELPVLGTPNKQHAPIFMHQ